MGTKVDNVAECLTCGLIWTTSNALLVGKKHHNKYGHKVTFKTYMEGSWDEAKKPQQNTLIPDWEERRNGKGTKNKKG